MITASVFQAFFPLLNTKLPPSIWLFPLVFKDSNQGKFSLGYFERSQFSTYGSHICDLMKDPL